MLVAAIQASANQRDQKPKNRNKCVYRHRLWLALGILCVYPHANRTEGVFQGSRWILQASVNESYMGNFEVARGVADWRIAATRIPAEKSVLCERHASEGFEALGKGDVLGKNCDNVRSSHLVQNIVGRSQEMRKGLTVFAIAHAPAPFFRVADVAFQHSAPALHWMVHVWSPLNVAWQSQVA